MRPSLLFPTCCALPTILAATAPQPISLSLNRRVNTSLKRRADEGSTVINGTSGLTITSFGSVIDTTVTFGNQTFQLFVDTGSSDTWVVHDDYTCVNRSSGLELPTDACMYSSQTYNPTLSPDYEEVPGEIFGIQYGDGIASGIMAYENVTLANITVNTKVGIANVSTPMGDGVNSGLFGLGYPALTSAHPGPEQDNTTYWYNRLPYKPLLFEMANQGLIEPYFSIALARTPQNESVGFGGYLTLGGLAPVNHSQEWATVPVQITENIPLNFTSNQRVVSYWTTTVDNIVYGSNGSTATVTTNTSDTTQFQAFFDNGNFNTYLPGRVVASINALFSPPAVLDNETGIYVVECDAVAPQFGITLGNQTFFHDGRDIVYQTAEGICVSNIASSDTIGLGGITLNIIGAPFFKNVLGVFDFGKDEIRFAKLVGEVHNIEGLGQEQGQGQGTGKTNTTTPPADTANTGTKLLVYGKGMNWFVVGVITCFIALTI